MNQFIRKAYRYIAQAKYEGKRTHDAFLRTLKKIPKADSLLDIGCGKGERTRLYADLLSVPRERTYGIELKGAHIAEAEEKINVRRIDLEKDTFPFEDQSIQIVICNQVLEHLKNIFLPLSEMDRVTKKGGYIVIGIPNLAALHNRMLMLKGQQPLCNEIDGPHVRCFTHNGILKYIKKNRNYKLVFFTGATIYPFPYPFVEAAATYLPGYAAYTFYILQKVKHGTGNCAWQIETEFDTCW